MALRAIRVIVIVIMVTQWLAKKLTSSNNPIETKKKLAKTSLKGAILPMAW